MKTEAAKDILKKTIEVAIHTTSNETEFKKQLLDQGINTVVRRNNEGRIYGITFIDHQSRSVWNGSQLGKSLSANIFNDCWNNEITQKPQDGIHDSMKIISPESTNNRKPETEKPHALFDFLNKDQSAQTNIDFGFIESLGSLLPKTQGEDYEEQLFANQMKKKRRKNGNKK